MSDVVLPKKYIIIELREEKRAAFKFIFYAFPSPTSLCLAYVARVPMWQIEICIL